MKPDEVGLTNHNTQSSDSIEPGHSWGSIFGVNWLAGEPQEVAGQFSIGYARAVPLLLA
jgi:hypothetical protein